MLRLSIHIQVRVLTSWNWYDRVPLRFIMTFVLLLFRHIHTTTTFWYYYIFLVYHSFLHYSFNMFRVIVTHHQEHS
jgi:hypothetical protein